MISRRETATSQSLTETQRLARLEDDFDAFEERFETHVQHLDHRFDSQDRKLEEIEDSVIDSKLSQWRWVVGVLTSLVIVLAAALAALS